MRQKCAFNTSKKVPLNQLLYTDKTIRFSNNYGRFL